jgi:hypothetical protein
VLDQKRDATIAGTAAATRWEETATQVLHQKATIVICQGQDLLIPRRQQHGMRVARHDLIVKSAIDYVKHGAALAYLV